MSSASWTMFSIIEKKAKSPNNFYQNNFNKKRKYKKNVKHDCDSINPKKPIHLIKIIIF